MRTFQYTTVITGSPTGWTVKIFDHVATDEELVEWAKGPTFSPWNFNGVITHDNTTPPQRTLWIDHELFIALEKTGTRPG